MAGARTAAENAAWAAGVLAPSAEAFLERFGTEEACEAHMLRLRYPGGFECERCGGRELARVGGRREFRCRGCGMQLSATSGTAIASTKLPLTKWFRAAWMVARDPRGASAQAVARECGVSDATGLAMLRRLRAAMGLAMSICRVGGDWVEVDGAHVRCGNDGTAAVGSGPGRTDAPVLVAVSGSRMAIRATSDLTGGTVEAFAAAHVSRGHPVRCDEARAHGSLAGGWDARPARSAAGGDTEASLPAVHHAISNLKAWLVGTFHGVSVGRLQEYADEFSWRYCHRGDDAFAALLLELARWPRVPLSGIREVRRAMGPHPYEREPGWKHNWRLRDRWEAAQAAACAAKTGVPATGVV